MKTSNNPVPLDFSSFISECVHFIISLNNSSNNYWVAQFFAQNEPFSDGLFQIIKWNKKYVDFQLL